MGSDEQKAKPSRAAERAAERGTQSSPEETPDEVRYTHEQLIEGARGMLGVNRHAVAGALAGESQKTFTLDEASELVNTALKREHDD